MQTIKPILKPQPQQIDSNVIAKVKEHTDITVYSVNKYYFEYLNKVSNLLFEDMKRNTNISKRNAVSQDASLKGIMAEIFFGDILRAHKIYWTEADRQTRIDKEMKVDLGDYSINGLIYDLKVSNKYANISTHRRTEEYLNIAHIIGGHIDVDFIDKTIKLYIYGTKDYASLHTKSQCRDKWNVAYQIVGPHSFKPLSDGLLIPQLRDVKELRMY